MHAILKENSTRWNLLAEPMIRGAALFLGGYSLCSWLLFWLGASGYDAMIWWVDLRFLPGPLRLVVSLAFAAALLHRAVWPCCQGRLQHIRQALLLTLSGVLVLNALGAIRASGAGVMLGVAVPLSAVLSVGVAGMSLQPTSFVQANSRIKIVRRGCVVFAAACGFALLAAVSQMFWFGESDYRRPADAILVYGCKAYPDGTPSQALADRVHTASELYHQGLAPVVVMSGGPVFGYEDTMHETQAMADYAVSLGVPREAILLDPEGLNTQATAENAVALFGDSSSARSLRVLAVSHDYHLPRVKLSLERQGLAAYTVPCEIRRGLPSKPYLMARETAAWWYYFFRPIAVLR